MLRLLLPLVVLLGCATSKPQMGVVSDLSRVEGPAEFCDHKVPEQVCTRHHPELAAKFKAVNDWCGPHGVPESQCFQCHPELTFEAIPELPATADVVHLSKEGEDVADLAAAAVNGKVTVFDFWAPWCAACREIDVYLHKTMNTRADLALRKLNVVDWDTPLAKRYLADVAGLPFLIVYGKDGEEVARIQGFSLEKLEAAIARGAQ